jgi:hypothetical protein
MFETLSAGRVPVIIADDWVAPTGPDWPSFTVRVAESDIAGIPRLLATMEDRAASMGALARQAHEEWFAPDVVLDRQLDQLQGLMATEAFASFPEGGDRRSKRYWQIGAAQRAGRRVGGRVRRMLRPG